MGFSGIMEQKIQMKNIVRNYNASSGTDRRRTSCFCLLKWVTVLRERFQDLTAADHRMETRIKLSFAHRWVLLCPPHTWNAFKVAEPAVTRTAFNYLALDAPFSGKSGSSRIVSWKPAENFIQSETVVWSTTFSYALNSCCYWMST